MRTPPIRTPPRRDDLTTPTNQQEGNDHSNQLSSGLQAASPTAKSDDEQHPKREVQSRVATARARPAIALPNRPVETPREKRSWQTGSRQQLLERTRNRIRRSNLQQPLAPLSSTTGSEEYIRQHATFPPQSDYAEEIENEAAEIRTLIARTAQLWSAVERSGHDEEALFVSSLSEPSQVSRPSQFDGMEEEDSTVSEHDGNEQEGDEDEDEDPRTESVDTMQSSGTYCTPDDPFSESLRELAHDETLDVDSDQGEEIVDKERNGLQLEQGEVVDVSNRAINSSKTRAIQSAMLGNLIRLGFREDLTRTALEAGSLEIDHYDADCELAYVDIFMLFVKMVCDAHVDVLTEREEHRQTNISAYREDGQVVEANELYDVELRSFLPFKWPVFDMAQFEFGNARQGTCFNSVCVLTNLPKVAMDRTEELMELLSCNLFCMLGDPIQVVIPSTNSSGRTKGHAFLEFEDPDLAKRCALAIDGLTWGRGPFGRIRGNLFRHYQVKSPAERCARDSYFSNDGGSASRSLSDVQVARYDERSCPDVHRNRIAERFRPHREQRDVTTSENLFCDSDDDSRDGDGDASGHPLEYVHFGPSPLLDLSSDSAQQEEQVSLDYGADWHDEALSVGEYSMQIPSEGGDRDYENGSIFEFQALEEDNNYINQNLSDSRCSLACASLSSSEAQAASSTVPSTASASAREAITKGGINEQSWIVHDDQEGSDKPWRKYCEDLIARNREMYKQLVLARRRIVQLSHNNQKLHVLVDRVEQDRDGLLYENDVLQTQVHGYADHEQHHDSLMHELVTLRQHLKQKEPTYVARTLEPPQYGQAVARHAHASFHGIQSALSYVSATVLSNCKMDELKDWEHVLETTLNHVRSAKEEKALEMQMKLDRQVEEQNELKLCVICLANDKTILCLPCRHLCLCKACSCRQEVTKCPICRLEIDEMLAVYS